MRMDSSRSPAPPPATDAGWHAQPISQCPAVTPAGLPPSSQVSSRGGALTARKAKRPEEGCHLMHQPSLAAWVPPHRMTGLGLAPPEVPSAGDMSPFRFEAPSTGQHSGAYLLAARHSEAPSLPLAQRATQEPETAAQYPAHIMQPLQQTEMLDHGRQALQKMQQQRAGASANLAPSGASLPGNEDSLCAFLGSWQRASAAPQPRSGLGTRDAVGRAGVSMGSRGAEPASAAGGRLAAAVPSSAQLQQSVAAKEVQERTAPSLPAQGAAGDGPAQSDPAPSTVHSEPPAGRNVLGPQCEAREKAASGCGPPVAAAAEQLLHAEGEDFWRSLLTVVRDYEGEAASARVMLSSISCHSLSSAPLRLSNAGTQYCARSRCHTTCRQRCATFICAGSDSSLGAWVRRVAAKVASKDANPPQALEHQRLPPVAEAAAACQVAQKTADTVDEAPKQRRPRAKAKPRKPAKRTKTAVADADSDRRGAVRVPARTHHLVRRILQHLGAPGGI